MSAHASSRRLAGDYPDLRAVVFALRRGWWAIALCALGFAAVAALAGSRAEVRYEASTSVLVGRPVADLASLRAAGDRAPTYGNLASSRRVVAAARARLGLHESVEQLLPAVTAKTDGASRLLTITAQATTAAGAAQLANAIATELGPTVLRDARTAARELRHVDPAVAPRHPIASHQHVLTAFAALAGALAGLTLVLLVEYFRGRVTTAGELAEVSGAPMLGDPRDRTGDGRLRRARRAHRAGRRRDCAAQRPGHGRRCARRRRRPRRRHRALRGCPSPASGWTRGRCRRRCWPRSVGTWIGRSSWTRRRRTASPPR